MFFGTNFTDLLMFLFIYRIHFKLNNANQVVSYFDTQHNANNYFSISQTVIDNFIIQFAPEKYVYYTEIFQNIY